MGFLDGLFGGMFDLDGDGRSDLGEEFMAFKMFEEVTKDDDDGFTQDSLDDDFDEEQSDDDFDDDFDGESWDED